MVRLDVVQLVPKMKIVEVAKLKILEVMNVDVEIMECEVEMVRVEGV